MNEQPIIHCHGLGRAVRGMPILDGVDLAIAPGEFVIVSGPSGAGKTTLLRLIAGLDAPTSGTVVIAGREMSAPGRVVPPAARGVGMVFEQAALWPHLSVEQHLALVLRYSWYARDERRARMERLLERLKIQPLRKRFPHELSGGERHRVALARSLALSPAVLLLDEPLAHLDVHLADQLAALLIELHREERLTTLCVMHRPGSVNEIADRYVIIEKGRLVMAGKGEDVFAAPETEFLAALGKLVRRQ